MYWYRSIIAHNVGQTSPQVRLNVSAHRDVLCRKSAAIEESPVKFIDGCNGFD
jgi:hypothetical protein